MAIRGIEWVELAFLDVNMRVHFDEHVNAEIRDVSLNTMGYPAFYMKLRRESAENVDFSGPQVEFKKLFSGRNRI